MPQEISAKAAHELIQSNPKALLIDVRTSMEFLFVGHPKGAINIPWIDEPDWVINPQFTQDVRRLLLGGLSEASGNTAPIILICRSGKRSLDAGQKLLSENIASVHSVKDGFEGNLDEDHQRSTIAGWRHAGLPWEQC